MKKNLFLLVLISCFTFFSCDSLSGNEEIYMTGISVYTSNCKTSYYLGEKADFSGIVVKANYIGQSSKDVTNLVEFSGFDSSTTNSYQKITVYYSENGETYSAPFYISISKYPQAKYPYDKNRIVNVSFQYYRRESTANSFELFTYSEEENDDINGSVTFKINDYGMNYKVDDIVDIYKYYPNKSYQAYTKCNIDENKIKATKYINGNTITLNTVQGGDNVMPCSYLFTDKADILGVSSYGTSTEVSVVGAKTLTFEDDIYDKYRTYYNKGEQTTFKGIEYPRFETDSNNFLTKGTILTQINNYFICILTVETTIQDVDIDFPAELWGIDHIE